MLKRANFDTALQFNSQGADLAPTFGTSTVAARTYRNGQAIESFAVPAASGGNGALAYRAAGLPAGLSFGAGACGAARVVCGTPTMIGSSTTTITVVDGDGNTHASDRDTLAFTIAVTTAPGVTLSTSTLLVQEGASAEYALRLATRPLGAVTVAVSGDGVITANPMSLEFSMSTWDTAQTFTIRAGEDDDGQDETATLTLDPSGADYDDAPSRCAVRDVDGACGGRRPPGRGAERDDAVGAGGRQRGVHGAAGHAAGGRRRDGGGGRRCRRPLGQPGGADVHGHELAHAAGGDGERGGRRQLGERGASC